MTNSILIAFRNGLILGMFVLVSQLIALGRFPTTFELYSTFLAMALVIITEIMNCFKLQPPSIDKKASVHPIFFDF